MPANSDTIDNPKKRVKLRVQCSNGYKFIAFVPCEYDYSALKAHIQLQYAKMYPKSPLISVVAMKDAHQFDIPQFDKENRVSDFFQDGDVAFATVEKDNSPHSHTTTVDNNVDCHTSQEGHSNSRSEKQSRKKDKRKQAIISSPAKSTSPNLDNTQISSSGVLEHTNNASVTSAGATSKQHRDGSSKGKMVDSKSDSITEDECENDPKDAVKKNLFNEKTASGGSDTQEPTSKPGQSDVNMEDIVDIDDRNSAESTPDINLHSEQNANTTAQPNTSGDGVTQVSLQIEPANSNNEMNEILPEHSSNPVIQKSKTETSTDVEETGDESSGSDSESESGDDSDDDSVPAEKDKSEVSDSDSDSSAADTSASDLDNNSDDDDDSADEVTSNQVKAVAQNRNVDPPAKTIATSLPNTTKTSLPAKFDGKTSIFAQHTKPTAVSNKPASQVATKSANNAFASLASLASGGKTDLSSNKPAGLGNGTFIANGKSEPKTSLDFTLPAVKFDFNPLKHTNKPSANLASIFATAKANNSEPSSTNNNNNKGKKIRKASTLSTRKKPAKKSKLTSLSLSIDSGDDNNNNNNSDNDIISDTERVVTPKKTAETLYKRQRGTRSNTVNSNSSSAAQSPITTSPPQTNSLPTTAFAETVHQPDGSN